MQMIFLAKTWLNVRYWTIYIVTCRIATITVSRLLIIRAIVLSKLATCCLLVIRLLSRQIYCVLTPSLYIIHDIINRDLGYMVQYISVICSVSVSMSMSHRCRDTRIPKCTGSRVIRSSGATASRPIIALTIIKSNASILINVDAYVRAHKNIHAIATC